MKKQYVSPETLVRLLGLQTIVCGSLRTYDDKEADPDKPVLSRRRRRNQWDDEEEEDEEAW